ncbi:MAG TPA: protein kinase [Thermoanaerobaculia bacterium]|jgi:serine/threonine protein kinase/tetratricopeptide (TPR) repeat protein|nr:protein kinase [Thermoanaerobaculia bacterium]
MAEELPTFEGFEIVRILGKGGMGTVYLARDQRLGRYVAIKVLNASELAYDDRKSRFLREARSAASIRHQNVATIHEVGETPEGLPFIVMEYCEGETLSQRIRRRPIESAEFLTIARQIAAGLAAAHEKNIIHRDIKSANIIVEQNGTVKILDFGLAKSLPRSVTDPGLERTFESTSGHFFGTLHFLSPEQARGANADVRSDLFSVGVVLYHMAAGHLPFNAEAPLMVLDKIRDGEPEPFSPLDPSFPQTATRIVARLLQKEPEDRYQSARDLLQHLEDIDTPTVRMTTTSTRTTLGRTMRRPRWIRVAITIAAALVVAFAVFIAQRTSDSAQATTTTAPPPIRSLAVLPLRNIANSTRDEFLSVGLADALVTKLQQIPSLQVRPTSAVLEFQGAKTDTRSASEKLKVDGILEGHFLAAGDLVRVTLQLTDARTGFSVWSDTIDGNREDLLKLIDDVSGRTVAGLTEKIGVEQTHGARSDPRSSNPQAYEQYLRARALTGSFLPEHLNAQIAALKRAIALDPQFAAAYADLATTLSLGSARALVSPEEFAQAEWYARQAVRLDPNLPEAHLALGRVFVRDPARFRESVREVLAALRLETTDTQALNSLVTYFVSAGDLQKAQCVGDRLVKLDPLSNDALTRGYWNVNAIDPEGAIENAQHALGNKNTELAGHDIRGSAFILQGNLQEAEKEANLALQLVPRHYLGKSLKAMIAAAKGDRNAALAAVRTFEADAMRNHWAALRVALVYAKLGDNAQALQWLRRCADLGNHSWYALIKHPWLQPLQSTPEFQEIVTKIKEDLDDVRDDVIGVYQLMCK